jgi:hypothetical protein
VDQALSWKFGFLEHAKKFLPHSYQGFDNEGRPVYIELAGKMQIKELLKHVTVDEYIKYHIAHWEYVTRVL